MSGLRKFIDPDQSLSRDDMAEAMRLIMDGDVSATDISAFLTALTKRGETVNEIAGAATILREKALTIKAPEGAIDCCGTGGDGQNTYNISTAVALVAAACGVPVAKHGNRASSSKSGAADVLEALGVNLDISPAQCEQALSTLGFAFLMAPRHHQAMKHVVPVRKALGFRTIFNILGPLANPAGTKKQLIGVYSPELLVPMAQALALLGTEAAWVVHGCDGLDEITITGPTEIAILDKGAITRQVVTPEHFGLSTHKPESLTGGSAEDNAAALAALLNGKPSAYRDIVIANTAVVLTLHTGQPSLKALAEQAAAAIDSGKAAALLESYIALTNEKQVARA